MFDTISFKINDKDHEISNVPWSKWHFYFIFET